MIDTNLKSLSITVTGAAGFIGSHLVKRLIGEKCVIECAVDSFNPSYDRNWCNYRQEILVPEIKIMRRDILEETPQSLAKKFGTSSVIIHLAAFPGVRKGEIESSNFLINNVNSVGQLIEAVKLNKNIKAIIFASSSSVYGDHGILGSSSENDARSVMLKSNYAMTKWINEIQFEFWQKKLDIPIFGLRFFTVFGNWGRPDMAYSKFTKNIMNGEPVTIFGKDGGSRTMTHIEDAVELVIRLTKLLKFSNFDKSLGYQVFNIASNNSITALDLSRIIGKSLGKEVFYNFKNRPTGDALATSANTTKINKYVGFIEKRDLYRDIVNYVSWHKDNSALFNLVDLQIVVD
jgi:UDP-glucuronate 4-epimerase